MADPITSFQSVLPQLLQYLAGSNTTVGTTQNQSQNTGSTGTSAQNVITGGNIDPLMQVFQSALNNSQMSPDMAKALIGSIFTEGSKQIPSITQAYANAVGARTTGNSGLALALDELNRQMSSSAMNALMSYQTNALNTAGNAASNIGADTRTTQTTGAENKNTGTTTTTGTNQTTQVRPGTGANNMFLAGILLNQLDKKGMLDGIKTGNGGAGNAGGVSNATYTNPSPMTVQEPSYGDFAAANANYMAPAMSTLSLPGDPNSSMPVPNTGVGGPTVNADPGAGNIDLSGGMNFGGTSDVFTPDYSNFAPDSSMSYGDDFANTYGLDTSGGWDWLNSDTESFFVNGGLVRPASMRPQLPVRMSRPPLLGSGNPNMMAMRNGGRVVPRMANGGPVRNQPFMGTQASYAPLVNALNQIIVPPTSNPVTLPPNNPAPVTGGSTATTGARLPIGANPNGTFNASFAPGAITADSFRQRIPFDSGVDPGTGASGTTDASNTGGVVGTPGQNSAASLGAAVTGISSALGIPGIALGLGLNALGMTNTSMNPISQTITNIAHAMNTAIGLDDTPVDGFVGPPADPSIGPPASIAAPVGSDDSATGSTSVGSIGGISGTGTDGTSGIGNNDGGAGVSAGVGVGDTAYNNGGKIAGPGTGTSDSIPAMLSDGEYVIPADVVRRYGTKFFDQMIASAHTPA